MVVSKILEQTLAAGETSVTFTDESIPNSLIRVFSNDADLIYESITLVSTSITVTYAAQTVNKSIALEIIKSGLSIIDNLTSDDDTSALSAKQGNVLKGLIDNLPAPITELSELDDVELTSLQTGQTLVYDGEKFINSTPESGIHYSETEKKIGTWIDGSTLYRKVIDLGENINISNSQWTSSGTTITNLDKIVYVGSINSSGTFYPLQAYHTNGAINLMACRDGNPATSRWLILEYTKTTD